MRLPDDWTAERASGWWEVHHLTHTPCGWRTTTAYDLRATSGAFGEAAARQIVYGHRCDSEEG